MTKRKHKVILSERADVMLLNHTTFLAKVSTFAARRLISDFKAVTANISRNPEQSPYADELDVPGIPYRTYRKSVFSGRYKALFFIEDNTVYIDAIIDCRQDNNNIFCRAKS
jgi:plasmid stabilization system protein ParE